MPTPLKLVLYQQNDQVIELQGISNGVIPGTYVNDATVTGVLIDRNGATVTGCSNLQFLYVDASDGVYRCQLQETFNPTKGGGYKLEVTVSGGTNVLQGKFIINVEVKPRVVYNS